MNEEMQQGREDWRRLLHKSENGVVQDTMLNVSLTLQYAPMFAGRVCLDEFANRLFVDGSLPWQRRGGPDWTEDDNLELVAWLQAGDMRRVRKDTVMEGVRHAALQAIRNPVREYLDALQWDGRDRLTTWFREYLGVERTQYTDAIAPKVLVAAVARIFEPGCKVDTVLVLEGRQGVGKSTAIGALFGEDYVTDSLPSMESKDSAIQLRGIWAVELAELGQLKRNAIETAKAFISRRSDHYRAPYEREARSNPRSCVFLATTNETTYLKDPTGGRRFWPIDCGDINLEAIARDRDQLWAEAVTRYHAGELWHLDKHEAAIAAREQMSRFEEDIWSAQIDGMLIEATKESLLGARIKIADIASGLEVPTHQRNALSSKRIAEHLRSRRWEQKRTSGMRFYVPTPEWGPLRDDMTKERRDLARTIADDLDSLPALAEAEDAENTSDIFMSEEQLGQARRSGELLLSLISGK